MGKGKLAADLSGILWPLCVSCPALEGARLALGRGGRGLGSEGSPGGAGQS